MKIAMIGQKGMPAVSGGIERHVEELSKRLAAAGHEVIVYCRKWYIEKSEIRNSKFAIKHLQCVTVPTIKSKHLDAIVHTFVATLHALRRNPHVYHYHGVGPSLLAWMPRLFRPHSRVIITFHCIDRKHQKWGRVARLALRLGEWAACRFAHTTITVSRTLEQYCRDVYETPTVYIPNGVTEPRAVGSNLIKRFTLEPNQYVVMVSRLVRHKGAHHLIRAWQMLRHDEPTLIANLKLVIVGDAAFTDDYIRELKTLAADDASIVFTGSQSGAMLDELFGNALFVVHPSESEGLPIVILEAMSFGKLVVASDIPENMELVADYGVAFRSADVTDLAATIKTTLINRNALPEAGARARVFVLAYYHWDDIARQVDAMYRTPKQNITQAVTETT